MKALVVNALGSGFDSEDIQIAAPVGREVLVDVRASGLCHTDLLFATHDFVPLPAVLGHEVSGVAAAVGPDVGQLRVGDHVVGSLAQACGACARCLAGRSFQCRHPESTLRRGTDAPRLSRNGAALFQGFGLGGFAEQALIHENQLAVVPKELPFAQAALLGCGVVTGAGSVLNTANVSAGDTVVIFGAGVEPERQGQPALTDAQVVGLAQLGRRIEAHFGRPQDIEWCLVDDGFQIVQSRPITTLFPIPEAGDGENHVYVSVGHQQMMTDPIKPLGLSFWQMTTPRPMAEAGGRLFVDVTRLLASTASREGLLDALGRSDPLIGDALRTVLERDDFIRSVPDDGPAWAPPGAGASASVETDPAIVTDLIERSQASIAAVRRDIQTNSGVALLDFILADIQELKRVQFDPRSMQVIMAGMEATWWLNDQLQTWLGERNAADTLTQSVRNNVTSEMGLALLDVADVIRPHPDVVAFLEHVEDENFLDELPKLAGGREARDAIRAWLDRYGMRGVGEIDITRPRWSECPTTLVPMLLGNVRNFVLREKEDIFSLTFQELQDVVRTNHVDDELIRQRKDEFRLYQSLTPPRVLTSDGEAVAGSYRREDLSAGVLAGLPVSAGTVEGRARVILDITEADLEAGDILVTAYTDPSWTPLFVAIKGLVTEVGGLMTHGAVIAREYGLPAVVGVQHATRLIRNGQRIRVHGTDGYVEILPESAPRRSQRCHRSEAEGSAT